MIPAPRAYKAVPLLRQHSPRRRKLVAAYQSCLRLEFSFECFYCLVREQEAGPSSPRGGFEVEHFRPRSQFPEQADRYDNLVWSCPLCNRAKGDAWPTRAEQAVGRRFPEPAHDPLGKHLLIVGDRVEPVGGSQSGQYMIDMLALNRAAHLQRRKRRRDIEALMRACALALEKRANEPSPDASELQRLAAEMEHLRRDLGEDKPWDAPESCSCTED